MCWARAAVLWNINLFSCLQLPHGREPKIWAGGNTHLAPMGLARWEQKGNQTVSMFAYIHIYAQPKDGAGCNHQKIGILKNELCAVRTSRPHKGPLTISQMALFTFPRKSFLDCRCCRRIPKNMLFLNFDTLNFCDAGGNPSRCNLHTRIEQDRKLFPQYIKDLIT